MPTSGNANNFALPINLDERNILLGQPGKNVKGNAAGTIQKNYSIGQIQASTKKAEGVRLLRIMGEAIFY